MSTVITPSTPSSSFDVATAALEHLELLNCSNVNPLEIAAQFRTLLRRKKSPRNSCESSYTDYLSAAATTRRHRRQFPRRSLAEIRSKSLGRVQYFLDEDSSFHSSWTLEERESKDADLQSIDDVYADSAVGSDLSDRASSQLTGKSLVEDLETIVDCFSLSRRRERVIPARTQAFLLSDDQLERVEREEEEEGRETDSK